MGAKGKRGKEAAVAKPRRRVIVFDSLREYPLLFNPASFEKAKPVCATCGEDTSSKLFFQSELSGKAYRVCSEACFERRKKECQKEQDVLTAYSDFINKEFGSFCSMCGKKHKFSFCTSCGKRLPKTDEWVMRCGKGCKDTGSLYCNECGKKIFDKATSKDGDMGHCPHLPREPKKWRPAPDPFITRS